MEIDFLIKSEKDGIIPIEVKAGVNVKSLSLYGVSWHRNGFIIKIKSNVIVVEPCVDFILRLTESGFNLTSMK
ncbi:MAG: hypothetical protein PHX04_06170 [Bacilli bacterium]|nr:hypothetical protein [Bacilli bacterium]